MRRLSNWVARIRRSCGAAWKQRGCISGVELSRVLAREAVGFICTELEGELLVYSFQKINFIIIFFFFLSFQV